MRDSFSSCHPVINFIYFAAVIAFSMFFLHPVLLGISLSCAILYSICIHGRKAVKFHFCYMLPMLLAVAILNPVFNHQGTDILLYINDNPITSESIYYGIAAGVMLVSVIVWFSCYNAVMTSDKFMYVFGKGIPALSLILSMTLRFVPKFKAQLQAVSNAQACIGKTVSKGTWLQRMKNGVRILSILITWSLENAVETADSMKARGYGLSGRTAYSNYRFDRRDMYLLLYMLGTIVILLTGLVLGENSIQYFPMIVKKEVTVFSLIVYLSYGLLMLLPVILNSLEDLKWRRLQSKI